ncbi:hypothetical protein N5D79_08405 [Pseudomonas sp. GD03817]|uniref:hypothetical protein n=1 Tax=unclassified Pseudomonas TaxID=196821 RepID=UPI00244CA03F|nr:MULTISPECIES: hypothetical protein [unclassified Pseudomonas]MDH1401233.1 hypothetical protein [Pseudomonas sp. GD03730]MDH1774897.1 hypothetical protein [Pseudomonas sp. GD03817]
MSSKPRNRSKGSVIASAPANRAEAPKFANSFSLSTLHNEVVCIDFADVEEGYENIFSSVVLTKTAAKSFNRLLSDLIDSMDPSDEEHESENEN